jgi:hypothetical protein
MMGWWTETVASQEIYLGDEPLDRIHGAIAAISQAYLEDLNRKPTLEEFRQTLLQVLGGDPGQFFADMESHIVGDIVFRRKPIPKRQSFTVGDYFTIPLDSKFWYGRILHRGAADHLIEIYSVETDRLLTLRQLLNQKKRKVVLNKHIFSQPSFTRGRWRIIGHEDIPKDFKYPCFYGGMVAYGNYTIWRGDEEFFEPKAKAMKYEPAQVWWPERIEEALRSKDFGEWKEVKESKKDTFDNHDKRLQFLHEHFGIPLKKKKK